MRIEATGYLHPARILPWGSRSDRPADHPSLSEARAKRLQRARQAPDKEPAFRAGAETATRDQSASRVARRIPRDRYLSTSAKASMPRCPYRQTTVSDPACDPE